MKKIRKQTAEFLFDIGMSAAALDMDALSKLFLKEMEKGLAGKKSSLHMIPTYIEAKRQIPVGKDVIVLDAGGTNFRAASARFNERGEVAVANFRKSAMPGSKKSVTKAEFFAEIASLMEPVSGASDRVGFCFSYPLEMQPDKDGRILHMTKQIRVSEIEGTWVGREVKKALEARGLPGKFRFVLLNDTVTTLLAGGSVGLREGKDYSSYIGFILGTGTNIAYIERNSAIAKCPDLDPDGEQVINTESAGFSGIQRGTLDEEFDRTTKDPGVHVLEKMISGAYLGPLGLMLLNAAADAKLFSKSTRSPIRDLAELSTLNIDAYLSQDKADNALAAILHDAPDADKAAVYFLLDGLVDRAAKLAAIKLAACILKTGAGTNPCRPVLITAEGTTFYNLKGLKEKTECHLRHFLTEQKGVYIEWAQIEDATLIGAALAGLTN